MRMRTLITLYFLIIFFQTKSQNLITNPSFEQNGKPFCEGWYDGCGNEFKDQCDSMSVCGTIIIKDSPSDSIGGKWSLQVYGSFPTSSSGITYVTGQEGTFVYQLKFWMNSIHFQGEVYLGPYRNGTFNDYNFFSDFGQPWTEYTLLDTISTQVKDSIAVLLTAGLGDFCICDVAFDQIELTVIDTLSTSIPTPDPNTLLTVFPNPFSDNLTFQVPGYSELIVTIFDITSKEIQQVQSDGDVVSIDLTSQPAGIYFYQLTSGDHRLNLGRGKVIKN